MGYDHDKLINMVKRLVAADMPLDRAIAAVASAYSVNAIILRRLIHDETLSH